MQKFESVEDFVTSLSDDKKAQFNLLRKYIFESNSSLEENIKWNAPNYVFNGKDRITFNIMNRDNKLKVLLHKGAVEKEDKKAKPVMEDSSGLIVWNSNIRGTLAFDSIENIKKQHVVLVSIFTDWLKIL